MSRELYRPRPVEVVLWDGTDARAAELREWLGGGFSVDTATSAAHLWLPDERRGLTVPVGAYVLRHPSGRLDVLDEVDLAALYELVPAPEPRPAPDPEPDPAPAPAPAPDPVPRPARLPLPRLAPIRGGVRDGRRR